jgi:hypothetical protein
MLFKEITIVHFENYMKPINTLCGQLWELFIIKASDTYNYHWTVKSWIECEVLRYLNAMEYFRK